MLIKSLTKTDVHKSVCVYPEGYGPGALSDKCRFGRLFKVAIGGTTILKRNKNRISILRMLEYTKVLHI